jgi:hypothetical protein
MTEASFVIKEKVIPEVEEYAERYWVKTQNSDRQTRESAFREYRRIVNFSNQLIQHFPNYQIHLLDAQNLVNNSGVCFSFLRTLLRDAKASSYFPVFSGSDHHLLLALINLSGAWDLFLVSPTFNLLQNAITKPNKEAEDCMLLRSEQRHRWSITILCFSNGYSLASSHGTKPTGSITF